MHFLVAHQIRHPPQHSGRVASPPEFVQKPARKSILKMNTEKTTSKQNFHNEKHGFVEFFAAIFAERMFSQVIPAMEETQRKTRICRVFCGNFCRKNVFTSNSRNGRDTLDRDNRDYVSSMDLLVLLEIAELVLWSQHQGADIMSTSC
jgi:hypothetical protein